MYVRINGEMRCLWRAVDHEGETLKSYITRTRDRKAALAFMRKALKRHGSPEAITTDGLRSYKVAMAELGKAEKQQVGRWSNNRAGNSHLPFRRPVGEVCRTETSPHPTDSSVMVVAMSNSRLLSWKTGSAKRDAREFSIQYSS